MVFYFHGELLIIRILSGCEQFLRENDMNTLEMQVLALAEKRRLVNIHIETFTKMMHIEQHPCQP